MHVAMVTPFPEEPDRVGGGVAGVGQYLVDELRKHPDVELTVAVPKSNVQETVHEKWDGVDVYRVRKEGVWSFLPGTAYDILAGRRQIKALLRRINPDIVHYQGVTFLAANSAHPHILTIHGIVERDAMWDSRWGILRWLKWLLLKVTEEYGRRRVRHVILISEYVREFLPRKNRIHKSWFIENPIADSYFEVDWQCEPGRIFCCSRVKRLKNILGMIKAFALVVRKFPHARLRIAGSPEPAYIRECKQQVETNGLRDKVHFLGNLGVKDVKAELSKANCLCIPSFQENAPLTVEEAMAVGVPVVGARVGGIPRMVEDGETGLLVDPHDTEDIAAAVCRIFSDGALSRSMSQRSREVAERRFKASIICEQTLEAYGEVLSE
jgi:glycosyltransferase involved in cell wall biosynthesis